MCIHPETKWTVTSSLVHGCVMAIIKWDCILIFENYLTVRDKQCRMIVEGVQVACFNQEICVVTPSFLAWSFRDQCVAKFWSIGFKTTRKYFCLGIALTFFRKFGRSGFESNIQQRIVFKSLLSLLTRTDDHVDSDISFGMTSIFSKQIN